MLNDSPAAHERSADCEKAPATSSMRPSSSAAILCTGPMKAPGPPPTMPMRSFLFTVIEFSSINSLPIGECSVELAVDGQVGALVGIFGGQRLIEIDAQSGPFAGKHQAVFEAVLMREDRVRLFVVRHQLLDPEVVNCGVEVE